MPQVPELPEIPDLEALLPPLDELIYGPQECPVCTWYEENVCRPLMKQGDVKECGSELTEIRAMAGKIPEAEHTRLALAAFAKYGIDPNAPLKRK